MTGLGHSPLSSPHVLPGFAHPVLASVKMGTQTSRAMPSGENREVTSQHHLGSGHHVITMTYSIVMSLSQTLGQNVTLP